MTTYDYEIILSVWKRLQRYQYWQSNGHKDHSIIEPFNFASCYAYIYIDVTISWLHNCVYSVTLI